METTKLRVLVAENGSVTLVTEDENLLPQTAVLTLSCCLGIVLNVVALITSCSDNSNRRLLSTPLLCHLCLAAALDCILTQPISLLLLLVYVRLPLPFPLCLTSAASCLFFLTSQTSFICALVIDRCRALYTRPPPLLRPSTIGDHLLCALPWIYAAIMGGPLILDPTLQVRHFPSRNCCGLVAEGTSLIYARMVLIFGCLLPWLLIATGFGFSWLHGRNSSSSDSQELAVLGSQGLLVEGADDSCRQQRLLDVTWTLVLLYAVLVVPHMIVVSVSQLTTPIYVRELWRDSDVPTALLPVQSGLYDTIFVWARYQFNIAVPVVALARSKELRRECARLFCFCRKTNNTVSDVRPGLLVPTHQGLKPREPVVSQLTTPVLIATSEGLQLRIAEAVKSKDSAPKRADGVRFSCSVCDLNTEVHTGARAKVVHFSPAVKEIPLPESGVWSSYEDQNR